jgi:hypothetical protein
MLKKALCNLISKAVKNEINNTRIPIKAEMDSLKFYRRTQGDQKDPSCDVGK